MSEVSITINKRPYTVHCDDGQEAHLRALAARVDGHVTELVSAMGQIGDQRLLVMASLMLADELAEMQSDADHVQSTGRGSQVMSAPEASVVRGIEQLAERIDSVAAEIERAAESLTGGSDAA